ncbi:hypothetical protein HBB16_20445 [Pseudonocardia sp. MCCB 268]|nr:hypothetical protein [Pseudonocardia cytotoxica]
MVGLRRRARQAASGNGPVPRSPDDAQTPWPEDWARRDTSITVRPAPVVGDSRPRPPPVPGSPAPSSASSSRRDHDDAVGVTASTSPGRDRSRR